MANDWFEGGFKRAREVKEAQDSGNYEFGNNDASRFWVRTSEEKKFIFLDDFDWRVDIGGRTTDVVPFGRYEYKVDMNNHPESWKSCVYITCTKGTNIPCIPAERNFKRFFVGAMTILDVTPFKDRRTGEVRVVPRKKLMVATPAALVILETKREKRGNLKGWRFTVTRHEDRSPRVGNDFEAEEQITEEQIRKMYPNINLDPFGFGAADAFKFYREMFKPMPHEDQKKLFESNPNAIDGYNSFKGRARTASTSPGGTSAKDPEPVSVDGGDEVISY